MVNTFQHQPVLLEEVIHSFFYLKNLKSSFFVDGTIGLAGHSIKLALNIKNQQANPKIIGIDQDQQALKLAEKRVTDNGLLKNFLFIHERFENIKEILSKLKVEKIDGAFLDLGVSSMQLDDTLRGFSFNNDAPLDMRMNQDQLLTARNIINKYSEKELVRIFSEYGEERFSKTIARRIIEERKKRPIETTLELSRLITGSIAARFQRSKIHPATNIFRSLRMEVNREVADLRQGIVDVVDSLKPGGRVAVISFHSIEDRIVKNTFRELSASCICPPNQPICHCNDQPKIKLINKKPIVPSEKEIKNNPRSRSAKLRVIERV